jgi:hypothetical protein
MYLVARNARTFRMFADKVVRAGAEKAVKLVLPRIPVRAQPAHVRVLVGAHDRLHGHSSKLARRHWRKLPPHEHQLEFVAFSGGWFDTSWPVFFRGNLQHREDFHLIVIRGFTVEGDPVINDPASYARGNAIVYKADELAAAWFDRGGVGYVIAGPDR